MITNFTNGVLFVSFVLIRAIRFYFLSNQRAKGSFSELSQNETKSFGTLGLQKHSLSPGIFQGEIIEISEKVRKSLITLIKYRFHR